MKGALRILGLVLGGLFLFIFIPTCLGGGPPTLLLYLLTGWIGYLIETLPKVRINWNTLISTIVFLLAFTLGFHALCGWLYREMTTGRRWKRQWTLSVVAVVMLMFIAGTAAVGITHQIVFLATSERPMWSYGGPANMIKCQSNLRQIGQALEMYANDQGGVYPPTLEVLQRNIDITREVFICPEDADHWVEGDERSPTTQPLQSSYEYLGSGLRPPVPAGRIIAYESKDYHEGAINVLYGDGSAKRLDPSEFEEALKMQRPNQPATSPTP